MNKENYRQKLLRFNATEKYRKEMKGLFGLIDPQPNEKILDYGSGLGVMIDYLKDRSQADVYGYDKFDYFIEKPDYIRAEFFFKFDKIYFQHSIAHIEDIKTQLINIKENFLKVGGKIIVVTPNKIWLDLIDNPNYIPDDTVFCHYDIGALIDLFVNAGFKIEVAGQFGEIIEVQQERIYLIAKL